jgi:hypothetical protein
MEKSWSSVFFLLQFYPYYETHIKSKKNVVGLFLSLGSIPFMYSLKVYPVVHSQSHVRAPGQIYT